MTTTRNIFHYLDCTAMEFDQMQKIWNEEKKENLFVIDESALHKNVTRKKNAAGRRINKVEIGLILINSICSIILFISALNDTHSWNFIGSGLMLITVLYILYSRSKRKKGENTFDRSMLGELNHAISNTDSIIQFSRLMIIGYLVPFSIFIIGKLIWSDASIERWLTMGGMYLLAFILIQWERKKMHIPRKRNLEILRKKLIEDS
ncbi:MAG: hypothetical protein AB8B73_07690 [Ekhidna sp.]